MTRKIFASIYDKILSAYAYLHGRRMHALIAELDDEAARREASEPPKLSPDRIADLQRMLRDDGYASALLEEIDRMDLLEPDLGYVSFNPTQQG